MDKQSYLLGYADGNENKNALDFEIDSLKREIKVLKHNQDKFAIEFADWCEDYYYPASVKSTWFDNVDFDNANKFTTQELLEIFKKEKGL